MMTDADWLDHWLQRAPGLSASTLERIAEHLTDEEDD